MKMFVNWAVSGAQYEKDGSTTIFLKSVIDGETYYLHLWSNGTWNATKLEDNGIFANEVSKEELAQIIFGEE